MSRAVLLRAAGFLLAVSPARGQQPAREPLVSVRASVLLFPVTPLLTLEVKALGPLTLQGETNFGRTHGLNARWYLRPPLRGGYVFVGSAWVRHNRLRQDGRPTVLPYAGCGHAWPLGARWTLDARAGLGPALNADVRRVYPVVKVGAGRIF